MKLQSFIYATLQQDDVRWSVPIFITFCLLRDIFSANFQIEAIQAREKIPSAFTETYSKWKQYQFPSLLPFAFSETIQVHVKGST